MKFYLHPTVIALGAGVEFPAPGSSVMALLNGGGMQITAWRAPNSVFPFRKICLLRRRQACRKRPLPWHNLFELGRLQPGETVLIHGSQRRRNICHSMRAGVWSARHGHRGRRGKNCRAATTGVWRAINRHDEDFVDVVLTATGGRGVDVVLDNVGAITWRVT
jgi:hypothetical protein